MELHFSYKHLYIFFSNSILNVILLYFFSTFSVVGKKLDSDGDKDDENDDGKNDDNNDSDDEDDNDNDEDDDD